MYGKVKRIIDHACTGKINGKVFGAYVPKMKGKVLKPPFEREGVIRRGSLIVFFSSEGVVSIGIFFGFADKGVAALLRTMRIKMKDECCSY